MSGAKQPWAKLWWDWYGSDSHAEIGFDAIGLGPLLIVLAKRSPEPRWILGAGGEPFDLARIGRIAHMEGTSSEVATRVNAAILELVRAKTLERRPDGAFGFTSRGWARFQDSADSARMRKMRERKRSRSVTPSVTPSVTGSVTPTSGSRVQSPDVRGKTSEALSPVQPAAAAPPAPPAMVPAGGVPTTAGDVSGSLMAGGSDTGSLAPSDSAPRSTEKRSPRGTSGDAEPSPPVAASPPPEPPKK